MTLAPEAVRTMFDRIAPVYDPMNRVMTAGLDLRWRRLAAASVVRPGDRVLDAACGTGDLALADLRAGAARVTGLDFSAAMLERARRKSSAIEWVEGDLLALPFEDGAFDAATVGFGVRNLAGELDARPARAPPRAAAGRPARDPRDHDAARPAAPVLQPLVRPRRARAREGAAGRGRLHLPARRRCAASPPAEELAALLCEVGFTDVALPPARPARSSRSTRGARA